MHALDEQQRSYGTRYEAETPYSALCATFPLCYKFKL
jgi:hypothetical protein